MIAAKIFIGRKAELAFLQNLYDRRAAALAVIKGRRRIGKSRLVAEFASKHADKQFISLTGLAPVEGVSAQIQRDDFRNQLVEQLGGSPGTFTDWSDAFNYLGKQLKPGAIVLLDEISWMGALDLSFVSKLKNWWDTALSEKKQVLLVFCGSVSTWIEENILNSTAFFGRVALTLTLEPLSILESEQFLRARGYKGSVFEVYRLLSVLGGIPWYLEQVNPKAMADANIKTLCFEKNGLLIGEFDRIFHDLFNGKDSVYKQILDELNQGMRSLSELGQNKTLCDDLKIAGFVAEHYQWTPKTEKFLKRTLYRINDPFTRFYFKNIEPNRKRIEQGFYRDLDLAALPGIDAHWGLQVEQLLLQNRELLLKAMGINPADVLFDVADEAIQKVSNIEFFFRSINVDVSEYEFDREDANDR